MLRKNMSTWVMLILLSLVLGQLDTARAQSGYDPTAQTQTLLYNEARAVYLGNLAHRDNGVPPLRWNKQLTQAARWFSSDQPRIVHPVSVDIRIPRVIDPRLQGIDIRLLWQRRS